MASTGISAGCLPRQYGSAAAATLKAAYENSPGVVLLNSHFGNWELTGGFLSYDYRPEAERRNLFSLDDMAVVYKPLKSRMWDEIMCDNRCAPILRDGFKGYVPTEKVLRFAVGHGDRKMLYVFPTDQCPYKGAASNDTVDFMHQPTKTMLGGASIAHKFGYSVLYMSIAPVSKGRYEWGFTEICRDASKMTPHEIMQRYYELLQADIEKYPTGYLWSHKTEGFRPRILPEPFPMHFRRPPSHWRWRP